MPKGVRLSHGNILSNIEGMQMIFHIYADDNVCGVLPFFHSFGLTCSLWLPIVSGVSVVYCADPLNGKQVGKMARENGATLLFAVPSFLLNYLRRAEVDDFRSLRFVVAGAEKLREKAAAEFEEKFGIRPFEGYGATELSPVATLNLPNVHDEKGGQVGAKEGAIGHPLPGVAVKIVDPETYEPLVLGEQGRLLVKGPNVMLGYLDMEEKTAEVIRDGWYDTGDVAKMDKDGFLTLTDRLSRFSKISGEMVPHIKLEEIYMDGLGSEERVVAVTSVVNEQRGEDLVVIYDQSKVSAEQLGEIMSRADVPNLWKPKPGNYFAAGSIPVLGSGKINVGEVRKIAAEKKAAQ